LARKSEKEAKRNESISPDDALNQYDESYNNYQAILEVFKKYKWQIYVSAVIRFFERITKGIYWLIVTFILSIIAAILAWLDIFAI
jgi:membrane-bound acyltransferase YfiQ involved in biofilm formation